MSTNTQHKDVTASLSTPHEKPSGQDSAPQLAIEIRGLRKTYQGQKNAPSNEALKGVDLSVPKGSIFGLLGPNGAGKSTLINILAGLAIKSSGSVRLMGIDIDQNPRRARLAIGVVPQELNFDAFFTPKEVLELQAGLFGVAKQDRQTDAILKAVGLADKADAYSRSLSGGMRRRLLVAKALVHRPPVIILDEPTAGVDIELRRQLWSHMKWLNEGGVTIVLTTHYLEEAEAMCDQIAIIDHGEVVAHDEKTKLIKRLDEKRLMITVESPTQTLPSALGDLGFKCDGLGRLVVNYRPSQAKVGELLDAVRKEGIVILDLQTEEADLEELFVRLTSKSHA